MKYFCSIWPRQNPWRSLFLLFQVLRNKRVKFIAAFASRRLSYAFSQQPCPLDYQDKGSGMPSSKSIPGSGASSVLISDCWFLETPEIHVFV
jgi:hypothetical protein